MNSSAVAVDAFLDNLSEERRRVLQQVRNEIVKHLPGGYEEVLNWGMITYQVPLLAYPDTYDKQPLMLAGLASQKDHLAMYLTPSHMFPDEQAQLARAFEAAGKRFDTSKPYIQFKKLEDIVLEPIVQAISRTDMAKFVETARMFHEKRKAFRRNIPLA